MLTTLTNPCNLNIMTISIPYKLFQVGLVGIYKDCCRSPFFLFIFQSTVCYFSAYLCTCQRLYSPLKSDALQSAKNFTESAIWGNFFFAIFFNVFKALDHFRYVFVDHVLQIRGYTSHYQATTTHIIAKCEPTPWRTFCILRTESIFFLSTYGKQDLINSLCSLMGSYLHPFYTQICIFKTYLHAFASLHL